MNLQYNKLDLPVSTQCILCDQRHSPITVLNGINEDSASLQSNYLDMYTLSFDVSRYIDVNGELVTSNGYDELKSLMYLFLDGIGYFRIITEPTISNDGNSEKKQITAKSVDHEFIGKNLFGFKINTGEQDSAEYLDEEVSKYTPNHDSNINGLGIAINYCKVYNKDNPALSILDLALNKMEGWKVGYVDTDIADKEFTFNIDNSNVYTFFREDFAKAAEAVVVFNILDLTVNVYSVKNAGKDSSIYISKDNLAKNIELSCSEDSIFTAYNVAGGENLEDITQVNFGDRYIYNLDYYLGSPYVTDSFVAKYRQWEELKESQRDFYIQTSKEYAQVNSDYLDCQNRLPNDYIKDDGFKGAKAKELTGYLGTFYTLCYNFEHNAEYFESSSITRKEYDESKSVAEQAKWYLSRNYHYLGIDYSVTPHMLQFAPYNDADFDVYLKANHMPAWRQYTVYKEICDNVKASYYNLLLTETKENITTYIAECNEEIDRIELIQDYWTNGTFDIDKLKVDARICKYDAYNYCIERCQYALDNYSSLSGLDPEEYSDDWETKWDLFGTIELQTKYDAYTEVITIIEKLDLMTELEDFYSIMWDNLPAKDKAKFKNEADFQKQHMSFKTAYEMRPQCLNALNQRKAEVEQYDVLRTAKENLMAQIVESVNIGTPGSPKHNFTKEDYTVLNRLQRYTDFADENVLVTTSDSVTDVIDRQKTLYDHAVEKLVASSQPQLTATCTMDNFLSIPEFKDWHGELNLGDFFHLEIRPDYILKLRMMTVTYNPFNPQSDDLQITFTNMIKGQQGIDDWVDLLGNSTGQSSNSISYGKATNNTNSELAFTQEILALMSNYSALSDKINNTSEGAINEAINKINFIARIGALDKDDMYEAWDTSEFLEYLNEKIQETQLIDYVKKTEISELTLEKHEYASFIEFPTIPSDTDAGDLFIDTSTNTMYRWDTNEVKYYSIGADFSNIQIISCGSSV